MSDIMLREDYLILQRLIGVDDLSLFSDSGVSRAEQLNGVAQGFEEIVGGCKKGIFTMPDGKTCTEFPAILLHHSATKALFKPEKEWSDALVAAVIDASGGNCNISTIEFMSDRIPACTSRNGQTPDERVTNPISKNCTMCPLARFYKEAGTNGGSLCPPRHIVWLMIKGSFTPVFLRVTQMSLKKTPGMLWHFVQRQVNRRGIFGTYVKVSVEKVKNGANSYGVVHFDKGDDLMPEEIKVVVAFRAQWLSAMQGVTETVPAPDTIID